jgi:hypothetical protein
LTYSNGKTSTTPAMPPTKVLGVRFGQQKKLQGLYTTDHPVSNLPVGGASGFYIWHRD